MIYQDPLAYLLGLEGMALLDAWAEDHDREFTNARLADIRRLLDDENLQDRAVVAESVSTAAAYKQQAAGYDAEAGGGLFVADEPIVIECLNVRTPGVALDAACGTGRFAELLAQRGLPEGEIGDWKYWPWSLMDYLPTATEAIGRCPSLVIWHFQLSAAG